ncbi:MAG: ABC transporter permease [Sphaerochaetaceae bacterium]
MVFSSKVFIRPANLFNILRNVSMTGIIAFGMSFVIISGEIDLSIGSMVGLSGVLTALTVERLSKAGMSMTSAVVLGMAFALILSVVVGFLTGLLLTRFKMPSFIITLGMLNILYGTASVISGGFPITKLPQWYNKIGAGMLFNVIPVPALILVCVYIVSFIVLNKTKFGRSVYAVGGNAESARLSGINVNKVKIIVMMIVQFCSALSGIILSSQVMSGTFSFGKGWEMTSISAVIIGGASLSGGKGTVWGTFLGLLFLGIIQNAMTLFGVDEYVQYIVQGGLIIGAVLINSIKDSKHRL